MADFGRGMKAGVVTGIVYMAIAAILGAIYQNNPFSIPPFIFAAQLAPFLLRDLTDFSSVMSLLFQYIYRGLVFGAVFAALYNFLPGTASVKKGVVLSVFLCIVALVETIYTTLGWPTDGWIFGYSSTLNLSSLSLALVGIISALIFGALTGFLWDRFQGKELTAERKGRPVLLVSFILGLAIWVIFAVMFLLAVVISGWPSIQPEFFWSDLLGMLVVFLGLPGWILARAAWKKTKVDKSGFKWGVAGGVLMALTGLMLLPGVLAITGGMCSGGKAAGESSTAEAIARDKIERARKQKRRTNINRNIILLITSMTILTIVIIAVCTISPTLTPIEIRTWYDLDAIRDNLGGSYLLMNDLDSTTAGYQELAGPIANGGKGWQPIGTVIPQQGFIGFEGTFDGQGYEIRDLFINRPDELAVGLFRKVGQEGVIKDIGMVNATVTGKGFVGLFAIVGEGERIENISVVNATVTGETFVGCLVGGNGGIVSNSYATGSVTGRDYSGGLVGWNSGTVNNLYSTVSVAGNGSVGGLVGGNYQGTVSSSYSMGSVTGDLGVGGLVGVNSEGTVSNSYSTSSVTGGNSTGGLVGANGMSTISNSYSTGSVTGGNLTGGLVGDQLYWNTVTNCFWDIETSGQAASAGGVGKTTTEMQDITTFSGAGWNITAVANPGMSNPSSIWNIVDNVTYPFLIWQL
jgi:hypothetical protein